MPSVRMFSTGKKKNPLLQTGDKNAKYLTKSYDVWATFDSISFQKTAMCSAVCAFKLTMLNFKREVLLFIGSLCLLPFMLLLAGFQTHIY